MCYGYGIAANIDWKQSLGEAWDQYGIVLPLLAQSSLDEISIELAGSRVPPEVLSGTGDKRVAVGVIDVATDEVETPHDVHLTLQTANTLYVPAERLIASTNCGMAPMNREIAKRKLRSLVEGAHIAR